jgi:hypothetical protein
MNNIAQLILKGGALFINIRVTGMKTENLSYVKSMKTCGDMFHQLLSFTAGCCKMWLNVEHQCKQPLYNYDRQIIHEYSKI